VSDKMRKQALLGCQAKPDLHHKSLMVYHYPWFNYFDGRWFY